MTRLLALTVALLALAGIRGSSGWAQQQLTPRTLALDEKAARPKATIENVAWIAGHWQGQGLGGIVEEVWSPPLGRTMMGMAKVVKQDAVVFYEILTIVEESGSVTLNLKHFHPNLAGWEEKDKVLSFPLVKLTPNELSFEGMTFHKLDANTLVVFLAIRHRDGTIREEEFRYRRVGK